MPDAFIFALIATVVVVVAGVFATPATLGQIVDGWGRGFWDLIPFTLQMSLVIITGHVLATSRPMGRLIRVVAGWPSTPRGAVALVTFFAMASSWLNWGFSLMFSAVLAREVARRVEGVDYRALAAASFLGLGSIWAQGLSGSAALQMATPGALQPRSATSSPTAASCRAASSASRTRSFSGRVFVAVVDRDRRRDVVMWLATPPAGAGDDGARSRHRSRRPRGRRPPPCRGTIAPGAVARALADPHVAHRRRWAWRTRSLFRCGRRPAQRAQPQHRQPERSCSWASCCTGRRRG